MTVRESCGSRRNPRTQIQKRCLGHPAGDKSGTSNTEFTERRTQRAQREAGKKKAEEGFFFPLCGIAMTRLQKREPRSKEKRVGGVGG